VYNDDVLGKTGKKLYTHQEEGTIFLLTRNGCILADDMGLGKPTPLLL
jgi:SNF2 family DNA or RNA helicase